ncbi:hypothetical protein MI467_03245 [Delftia acidovorans]|uniref:hypothetical protein n=1 Tax=Delftia acidovorans TaxID=80866 RepID=UPI001EFCD3AE|nr:hypothetical protein [Delftia acidovorans]MCG8985852.1 hypothetical protein [Delftia acidovorans]
MDDAKQVFYSITQTVKERFSNPLIASFVISWCIWNYRLLIVIFGSGEGGWEKKITYISEKIYLYKFDIFLDAFLAPLATALVWIYYLPKIFTIIAKDNARIRKHYELTVQRASKKEILTKEESSKLERHLLERHMTIQKENEDIIHSLRKYTEEITKLNEEKKTLEKLKSDFEKSASELEKKAQDQNALISILSPRDIILTDLQLSEEENRPTILEQIFPTKKNNNVPVDAYSISIPDLKAHFPFFTSSAIFINTTKVIEKHKIIDDETVAASLILFELLKGRSSVPIADFKSSLEKYDLRSPEMAIASLMDLHIILDLGDDLVFTDKTNPFYYLWSSLGFKLKNVRTNDKLPSFYFDGDAPT